MNASSFKRTIIRVIIVPLVLVICVAVSSSSINLTEYDLTSVNKFSTFLVSIILQAFPFLVAGTLLTALISEFISSGLIESLLSRQGKGSTFSALGAALLFPVCDCAAVPVAAGLAKKGVHPSAVIIYMLAAPVINPIVILSTWYAFPGNIGMTVSRIILGITVPVIIGHIIGKIADTRGESILNEQDYPLQDSHGECCTCHNAEYHSGILQRFQKVCAHSGFELAHIAPFVIAGASISALIQTAVPKDSFSFLFTSSGFIVQCLVMTTAAFLMSVCSTSDAFIARGFSSHFHQGSLLSFMSAGPMIDVKNAEF